jgi:hypothetical protein
MQILFIFYLKQSNQFVFIEKRRYIDIQGDSREIMSPTELKMQPTIHLERKTGYLPRSDPALRSKCIVGCIFRWAHYYS